MGPTIRARVMVAVMCSALLGAAACDESATPAGILMSKIHGCTNVVASSGSK